MKKDPEKNLRRKSLLNRIADSMEITITIILLVGVVAYLLDVVLQYFMRTTLLDFEYALLLEQMLNLIIGIEFARMLCIHSTDAIVDVLLFAVARYIIVNHASILITVSGVVAIAILFGVRKYLIPDLSPGNDEEAAGEKEATLDNTTRISA